MDFFDEKKPWSSRKDYILTYYLDGYLKILPKVPPRRPILIVDAFAGRGRFRKSNEPGSPILICEKASDARERGDEVDVRCIESKKSTYDELANFLQPYTFAEAVHGQFLDFASRIAEASKTRNLFLYLDPFAVEGLEWAALVSIASNIQNRGTSIELLLNFNAIAFVRRARAALGKPDLELNLAADEELLDESAPSKPLSIDRIDKIVGGSWWKDLIYQGDDSIAECKAVVAGVVARTRDLFGEVCTVGIKAKQSHNVTKYQLIFASRAPLAVKIMNDGMVRANREDIVAYELLKVADLRNLLLRYAPDKDLKITRDELVYIVVCDPDGMARFEWKEIEHEIGRLIQEDKLNFDSPSGKLNKKALVWRVKPNS